MSAYGLNMGLWEDTILLGQEVLDALGHPGQVQIMINEQEKMMVLRPCSLDDNGAVILPTEHVLECEISGKTLLKKIRRITGWKDDNPRICAGQYLPQYQAVRFPLMEAVPVERNDQEFAAAAGEQ